MAMSENKFRLFDEDILRECVREKYARIVTSLDPVGYILDSLVQDTITPEEKHHIERLPERRSAALVDMLYTCRRPHAIAKFLKILSNEQTTCEWISD